LKILHVKFSMASRGLKWWTIQRTVLWSLREDSSDINEKLGKKKKYRNLKVATTCASGNSRNHHI